MTVATVEPLSAAERPNPSDWPGPGPIDLGVHDLPHASSSVEWWYVNCHLTAADGRQLSLFASFFRVKLEARPGRAQEHGHYLTWAVSDPAEKRYRAFSLLDPSTPADAVQRIDEGKGPREAKVARALREVFARGRVPGPDQLLQREARVAPGRLELDLDGNRFVKRSDGAYQLELRDPEGRTAASLTFRPRCAPVRHGDDGVVAGFTARRMFYYFVPDCPVEGTLVLDGQSVAAKGSGWYDHEFGSHDDGADEGEVAWNWISGQLDDGWQLSAYETFEKDRAGKRVPTERRLLLVGPKGERQVHRDFTLSPEQPWTSARTFTEYPTRWRVAVPAAGLELTATAAFPNQEMLTILSGPSFWEGRMGLEGRRRGQPVRGLGFVEQSGFGPIDRLDDFFAAVGRETRRELQGLLPASLDEANSERLFASAGDRHHLDGVDHALLGEVLIRPVREVVERGGKTWRSYGMIAALDAVGGDPERFRHWLALPELLHVGSLIVDDVEDRSDVRRGGPAAHKVHGEALAINAGNACYFLAAVPLLTDPLDPAQRVLVYESYFQALRSAHAGQALDIAGLRGLMPQVVESGDGELLEKRLLAIHRLKSAVPPGALARVGAKLGGGSDAQVAAIGALFEAFGVAFQIVDDVLNLRGFQGELKVVGEDLAQGKVTAPVAKAMARLDLAERRAFWAALSAKPQEPAMIRSLIATLERCGALEAAQAHARNLVEEAWAVAAPLLPDSHAKVMLRAFGWFVLERHY